ncbi:hypothetical protein GQ457_11G010860 [Hibiscus cannabinus]
MRNLMDQISELPQELLARILCLLPFEEVVRTSVVSRRWRDLWKFITVSINFDASKTLMLSRGKLQKHREGYVEWITRVLNSHQAPTIDELRVRCDLTAKYTRKIDRWIEVALMKKVRKLELDFQSRRWKRLAADEFGEFPDSECYEFGQKFCGSSEIKFLTSLCFKHVKVSGQVLEALLFGCPLLETLHVSHSQSAQLTKLEVCGASLRLKHLHICFCKRLKSIEIYAPNLVSFEYSSRMARHLVLRYVPQLRDVEMDGERRLKKRRGEIEKEYNDNVKDRISQLPLELLARIFSSLSFEEVVRTSVLSRIWRDLWKFTTVTLNFDDSKTIISSRMKLKKHREGYVEWITRVLNSHQSPTIDELRVDCDLTVRYTPDINRWIEVALMKKVKRLELDFKPCSSVHLIRDSGCYRFERRFCASSEIKLLTSLCFKHVNVCGQVLESVLSNCHLLETLHVSHSPSVQLTKLDVSGSSLRLKHLHMSFCKHLKRIEVYAPNLVSFEHSSRKAEHLVLRYVPQLRDVSYGVPWMCFIGVDGLRSFPGCLSTCASQLVNLSLQFLFEIEILGCPKLPNLRYFTCEVRSFVKAKERVGLLNLFQLIDSSPLLHKLKVELEMDYTHRLKKGGGEEIEEAIQVAETMIRYRGGHKTRSLREVEIVGFSGAEAETTLLIYLAKTTLNLDSIAINTRPSHWNRAAKAGVYLNKPAKARRWIQIALMKRVKRIELDFRPRGKLVDWWSCGDFMFAPEFCGWPEIKFLTSLCFKHVNISCQVLETFLSGCPLLETLHLSDLKSQELTNLNICGSSLRLKHLHISFWPRVKRIEVYAPNLVSFEYNGEKYRPSRIHLKYVPQLRDVSYGVPYGVPWDSMKGDMNFCQAFPSCLSTCVAQLVNLSLQFEADISLQKGNAIRMKKGSEAVRKLVEEVKTMVINDGERGVMQGLREVEIVGFVGAKPDTALLVYLANAALNLDNIVINTCPPNRDNATLVYKQRIDKPEEAGELAYDLLSDHRPEGAKFLEFNDNPMDRISELPQELLSQILSSVSLEEALRASAVSLVFRYLWKFYTGCLNFDASKTLMLDPKRLLKERDGYVEWITRVLTGHEASTIDELRVRCDLTGHYRRDIDRWIGIALMKSVKCLELDFKPCGSSYRRDDDYYRLGWKFCSSSEIKSLTSLRLKHVEVSGQVLESFLSNCPLLETLHVSHSKKLEHINVCGSSLRLQHLHVSFCKYIKRIEVSAPNLVSFEYGGDRCTELQIDLNYVPKLRDVSYWGQWDVTPLDIFYKAFPSCLAACSQLVNLSVKVDFIVPEIRRCPTLPNLRYLTCEFGTICYPYKEMLLNLLPLVAASPLLHRFEVKLETMEGGVDILERGSREVEWLLEEVETMISSKNVEEMLSLREVEIVGFLGADVDTMLLIYIARTALNLDKIVINHYRPHWNSDDPAGRQRIAEELEEASMSLAERVRCCGRAIFKPRCMAMLLLAGNHHMRGGLKSTLMAYVTQVRSWKLRFSFVRREGMADAMTCLVLPGSLYYRRWLKPPLAVCDKLLVDEGHTAPSGIIDASCACYPLHRAYNDPEDA